MMKYWNDKKRGHRKDKKRGMLPSVQLAALQACSNLTPKQIDAIMKRDAENQRARKTFELETAARNEILEEEKKAKERKAAASLSRLADLAKLHSDAGDIVKKNPWILPYFKALATLDTPISGIARSHKLLENDVVQVLFSPAFNGHGPTPTCVVTVSFSPHGPFDIKQVGTPHMGSALLARKLREHLAPVYAQKLAHPTHK